MPDINPTDQWYIKVDRSHPEMVRTDFRPARKLRGHVLRKKRLAIALAEFFKTQRLHKEEINELEMGLESGKRFSDEFRHKLRLAFSEGVLRDDLSTLDDDAFTGTCGQLAFKWIRTQFYGDKIIDMMPALLTDSSKEKGIDQFEICGDPNDPTSLYFVVWEVKATDVDISSRTDEIYKMHRKRAPRLIRGLELQLSLKYPENTSLGKFVRQLLEHWLTNSASKHLGGAVIHDTSHNPGDVFTTFGQHFPELQSPQCREVILIEVPRFRKTRKRLWKHLRTQIF